VGKKKKKKKVWASFSTPFTQSRSMAQSFQSLSLEAILDKDTNKNKADLLCPKEGCKCVILRKNTAVLVQRDGAKVTREKKKEKRPSR
jgi:hypothetical protein